MRLVLVDPNLVDASGHHRLYSSVIATEAMRRGIEVVLVANQRLTAPSVAQVAPKPLMVTTCYERFSSDPLFGAFDDVEEGNRRVLAELQAVGEFAGPGDLVLFHTVSHTSLLGTVSWIATLPREVRPAAAIFLMMPPGIAGEEEPFAITDPAAALGYRAAFRLVEEAGLDVAFFASGRQHARLFSRLAGRDIAAHALITCFDETGPAPDPDPRRILLFAGDAKISKGLALLPDVIRAVAPRHPDLSFRVQANPGPASGEAREVVEELRAMAGSHPNLDLHLADLDAAAYADLVGSAAVALMPYDPVEYRSKSSGIAWETIASAGLSVVPSGTWLEEEARAWSAPWRSFTPHAAKAVAEALDRAIAEAPGEAAALAAAAGAFAARNGIKIMMDELGAVWTAHGASHRVARPDSLVLPASRFSGEGWHGAETVGGVSARWSRATAGVRLRLPGRGRWELALEGIAMLAEEQVRTARLSVDGEELPVTAEVRDGAWRIAGQFGERAETPPSRTLTLALPWERTPAGDFRALGILATRLTATKVADMPWPLDIVKPEPASPDAVPAETGWTRPTRHASWRALLDPREDYVLSFDVHASADPATARSVRVFAGGEAVEARVRLGRSYRVEATLEKALLHRTGADLDLDVVLDAPAAIRMARAVAVHHRPAIEAGEGAGEDSGDAAPFVTHVVAFDETFDDPAFHHMEAGGPEGAPFRWMGREAEAAIQLPDVFRDAQTIAIHVHVVHRVDQEALEGLLIGLDGVYAERYDSADAQPGVLVRSAIVTRPAAAYGRAPVLSLKCTRRVDFSAHGDPRTLSVALSRIVVTA